MAVLKTNSSTQWRAVSGDQSKDWTDRALDSVAQVPMGELSYFSGLSKTMLASRLFIRYAESVPLLQRTLLSRLLRQLAQVYATVRITFVMELVALLRTEDAEGSSEDTTKKENQRAAACSTRSRWRATSWAVRGTAS